MGNCLVTKLKATVSNSALPFMGEVIIDVPLHINIGGDLSQESIRIIEGTASKEGTYWIVGPNSKIGILYPYDLDYVELGSNDWNRGTKVDINQFLLFRKVKYLNLTLLDCSSNKLSDYAYGQVLSIRIKYCNIGNSVITDLNSISILVDVLDFTGTPNISGELSDLFNILAANGKETSLTFVSNGVFTLNDEATTDGQIINVTFSNGSWSIA